MDKKKRKDNTRGVSIAAIGMCLILLAAYFLLSRTGPEVTEPKDNTSDNTSAEIGDASGDCPVSSSGIRLCELSPEQREREELRDRLNKQLSRVQNGTDDTDPYAPVKKSPTVIISPTSSVRLMVAIPGSDHADLVAQDLKKNAGVSDVYWSPPNLFDIKYDAARTSVSEILSMDIFKKYNASVVWSK